MNRTCIIHGKGNMTVPKNWINIASNGIDRLIYIRDGRGEYLENDTLHPFEVGKLYYLPYYANAYTYTQDDDRLVHAFVNFQISPPIFSKKVFCIDPSTSPTLKAAIELFCELTKKWYFVHKQEQALEESEKQELELLKAIVVYFVETMLNAQPDYIVDNPTVISALEIIHSSFAQGLTVREIAAQCYVSYEVFIRTFTYYVGEPPYSYMRKIKIGRALELKAHGATTEEAAISCGYSSASAMLHAISAFNKKIKKQNIVNKLFGKDKAP